MKELNKNCVYSLEELTSEEFVILNKHLKKDKKNKWTSMTFNDLKEQRLYYLYWSIYAGWCLDDITRNETTNAKELFYTLENIQVDCKGLSEERINEMCEVFIKNGYDYYNTKSYALKIDYKCAFMQCDEDGFLIDSEEEDKTTITYEKFMELFSEPQYEVKYIVEQPNDFKQITDSIASLLQYKNEKYGNSALEPLNVFQGKCKVGQRLDDKLARVKNNNTLQKNDVADLIGYLFLVCKENNWTNFDEFKD